MPVGNAVVVSLLEVAGAVLQFLIWILIASAVLSWLIAFGVLNPYSRAVNTISDLLSRITEPMLRPIRKLLPPMGNLDLSPLALIFVIYFLQRVILHILY